MKFPDQARSVILMMYGGGGSLLMRIDCHVHLTDEGWIHPDFMLALARIACARAGSETGVYPDAGQLALVLGPAFADPAGERLIEMMDRAGVDTSVVFPLDYGLYTGEPGVPIEEQNFRVCEAARSNPGRLVPFFSIDPRRPEAASLFSKAVEGWGARGLKLHPCAGFYAGDEACTPLYQICLEHDLPVLIHTGSQPAPFKIKYARPAFVDDVAADFGELKIIMAHVGHGWWEEALLVGTVKPNVCYDISGWQPAIREYPQVFYRMLRRLLDAVGPWRVFFGSDGPFLNGIMPLEDWVAAIEEPGLTSCPEVYFSDDEKRLVMGEAFARLVGMND